MINLKKALADSLLTNSAIVSMVWDRIYRKRNNANAVTPFIVYETTGYENRLGKYQKDHGYQGNKLTVDIVWEYAQEDQLDEIADLIIAQWWWFIGELTPDRNGTIAFEGRDEGYDPVTDYSIVRLFFLCKHTY